MKRNPILLLLIFLCISCSNRYYWKDKMHYSGNEVDAKIITQTITESDDKSKALLTGKIIEFPSNDSIPFLDFFIAGRFDTLRVDTDKFGKYKIDYLKNGIYNLFFIYVGFKPSRIDNIRIEKGTNTIINIGLEKKLILE